jgi:outer membrane protein OmpA-like peptidoglycan-associated protein
VKEVVKEVPGKNTETYVQSTFVVTFPVNSSEIENTSELDGIKSGANVEIVAYASPEGTTDANQKLSQERADSVAKYLQNKGVNVLRTFAKGADTNHANRIAIVTVK